MRVPCAWISVSLSMCIDGVDLRTKGSTLNVKW